MIRDMIHQLLNPGRSLSRMGHEQYRAKVRARVDEMRSEMGMPAVRWPK